MKAKSEGEVTQSCPTPSDPMDCSPPGSSVHGILQARILEWAAISFSKKKKKKKLPVYMITRFNHTNITLSKEAKLLCDEQLLDWQVVIEQKDADWGGLRGQ